ncbi:glycoside hydrolase family 25 protein [Streptomyces sp. NPDC055060]
MPMIVDVSTLVSISSFGCLKGNGYDAVVMRCYQSVGRVDPHFAATTANAWSAGIGNVDGYAMVGTTSPDTMAETLVKYIQDNSVKVGMIWLDVEGPGTYWSSSQSDNRDKFTKLLKSFKATGWNLGIYTSASQWNPIFGEDFTIASDLPLWYPHHDGVQSFADFTPFGGWTRPQIKQYSGDTTMCGVQIDTNWYPE